MAEKNAGVANMLRPRTTDGIKAVAETIAKGEVPTVGALNDCIVSKNDIVAAFKAQDEAREAGKVLPSTWAMYQPAVAEAVAAIGCRVAYQGQPSKQEAEPEVWPNHLGAWQPGRKIADGVRKFHISDLRKNVIDADTNIVKIGSNDYIVGTDDLSAFFLLQPSKVGNYAANAAVAKHLSLGGNSALDGLVGQINSRVIVVRMDDGTKPGNEVVFLPNSCNTWGYLSKDGQRLSYADIRELGDAAVGVKFTALDAPIVGNGFTFDQLFAGVKRQMSLANTKDEDGKTAWERFEARDGGEDNVSADVRRNIDVQTRVNPCNLFPYGFEFCQQNNPIVSYFGDSADALLYRVVVGARVGYEFAEGKNEAKRRLRPAPVKKAKAPKAQTPKKAKKTVTKAVEVAAPVEVVATPEVAPVTPEVVAVTPEVTEPAPTVAIE